MSRVSIEIRVDGSVYLSLDPEEFKHLDIEEAADYIRNMVGSMSPALTSNIDDIYEAVESIKHG